jgi:hypothetical protein
VQEVKILAQYTLGYSDPTWIVVPSELFDIRVDVIRGLVSRKNEEYARMSKGWGQIPHSNELHIRNNLKVLQVLPEKLA